MGCMPIITNNTREPQIFAYAILQEQSKILIYEKSCQENNFTEVAYSEHNCEVLNRQIERLVLEENRKFLQRYERSKKSTFFFVIGLVYINLCSMGQWDLSLLLMSAIALSLQIKGHHRIKENYTMRLYLNQLIQELKEKDIQLTKEEVELLENEPRNIYELDGKLFIGNALEVCNPKVLKKHFGEK